MHGILFALLAVVAAGLPAWASNPFRGPLVWDVILCHAKDSGPPPRDRDFYENLFFASGQGGIDGYWRMTSAEGMSLAGSRVHDWVATPFTHDESMARLPEQRYRDCLAAARAAGFTRNDAFAARPTAVITYPSVGRFRLDGNRLLLPDSLDLRRLAREIGQSLGLQKSESENPWDLMSAWNLATLNAHQRDLLGWLPRHRIVTFGADGRTEAVIPIASLNRPATPGALLVRVPIDQSDPRHYFTLEFRQKSGWDEALPFDALLVHEVTPENSRERSHGEVSRLAGVLRVDRGYEPGKTVFETDEVNISLESVDLDRGQLEIRITSPVPEQCVHEFVWREAGPDDRVCVTPARRAWVKSENDIAMFRRTSARGAPNPANCQVGFVWRVAFPGDEVCVSPESRAEAQRDNELGDSRRNIARLVQGPHACAEPYVWREADERDWVCVAPETRLQVQIDNREAGRRSSAPHPLAPAACLPGFVWREAFPGDEICVTPESREQARLDNALASERQRAR